MPAKSKPNELHITRIFNAPPQLVWEAWTNLDHVHQWWGPRGFTLTTHHKDLRVGGTWKYTMHGPDGTDYPNITVYHEVETYSRLVYDHGATESTPPLFRVSVSFHEHGSAGRQTRMEMTMALKDAEAAQQIKGFIRMAGGNSTWDRLAEHMEAQTHGAPCFIINRTFAAPIEQLYDLWTTPEHLARWLPPTGMSMRFHRAEIRVGGTSFYSMSNPDGSFTLHGRMHYLELNRPDRIVYSQEFTDANEKPSRHPGLPTWPPSMTSIVSFAAESADMTRVTVEWRPVASATPEEVAAFLQHRPSMTQGWTGSFNKLDEVIGREGF